ncbi:hypothetical protein CYD26_13440 [Pseudomonas sp. FFUP_PS_473]|nr:hypothetical protein [Pseudomonas sp. FFUP_PS_473]PLP90843.1 hypothetical protein CYD26_13440 [Pseudomonas sp. FFUP_PS_473]
MSESGVAERLEQVEALAIEVGKLFVDYAGQTVTVIDLQSGEIRQAQVLVAVLGASRYTFAETTWSH